MQGRAQTTAGLTPVSTRVQYFLSPIHTLILSLCCHIGGVGGIEGEGGRRDRWGMGEKAEGGRVSLLGQRDSGDERILREGG